MPEFKLFTKMKVIISPAMLVLTFTKKFKKDLTFVFEQLQNHLLLYCYDLLKELMR